MGKGSPPSQPDPVATANAQGEINTEAARLTRNLGTYDVSSPFGNVQYQDIGNDRMQANISLDPAQQNLLNQQNQNSQTQAGIAGNQLQQVNSTLSQPFNPQLSAWGQTPNAGGLQAGLNAGGVQPGLNTAGLQQLQQGTLAERDAYGQALASRGQQDIDRARDQTATRLLTSGISEGSQAWDSEMQRLDRAQNDLSMQALLGSGQEQSRLANLALANRGQQFGEAATAGNFANAATGQQFGQNLAASQHANAATGQQFSQNLAASQYANALRGQQMGEQAAIRNQPLNEVIALQGGQQIQSPQVFAPGAASVAPANYAQQVNANYQGDLNTYYQQLNSRNSLFGAAAGLGGAALSGWLGG